MIAAHNAIAAMTSQRRINIDGMQWSTRDTFTPARPYVMPRNVATVRAFDDPTIAVEAHHRMEVRFNDDANESQYEG